MSARPIHRWTPQEYYELERAAECKSEYYDGEIFNMSGGTSRHSLICVNLVSELSQQLKGQTGTPYDSSLRLRVKPKKRVITDLRAILLHPWLFTVWLVMTPCIK